MNRRKFLFLSGMFCLTPAFGDMTNDIKVKDIKTFYSLYHRLKRVEYIVGYKNFNIINFDEVLKVGENYSKVGKFTKEELDFVEYLFFTPADKFNFYGERTVHSLNNKINKKDIISIPHTGHFVYKGESLKVYEKMIKDIGDIYLTSGIRNIPKQLKLYLSKISRCNLNISKASFSIAPPGYSYHTISDFDVGKKGWGWKNFTSAFAKTKEFYEIKHLNYVAFRYRRYNNYGVRFEPWHIKVI